MTRTASLLPIRIIAGTFGLLMALMAGEAFSAPWHDGRGHGGYGNYPDSYCRTYYKHDRHHGRGHYEIIRGQCVWVVPRSRDVYRIVTPPPRVITVPAPAPVYVVPTPAPAPVTGGYCREYQDRITVGDADVPAYGTACRQEDGSWQQVAGTPPRAGDHCREFRRDVRVGGNIGQQYGTACLRPGAVWEIVSMR